MRTFNREEFKDLRKSLRNDATFAERIFWYSLRGAQLDGRKFRRQHGILNFTVDFYCPEEKLVIELDGDVHDLEEVAAYDAPRQQVLERMGCKVLRFKNNDVIERSDEVIATIKQTWQGRERESVRTTRVRSRRVRDSGDSG